jgi:hypothetical protein
MKKVLGFVAVVALSLGATMTFADGTKGSDQESSLWSYLVGLTGEFGGQIAESDGSEDDDDCYCSTVPDLG